jgi:glycosyltransferase involved in cell wall biosynthesis
VAPLLLGLGWFPTDRTGLNRYLLELGHALSEAGCQPRAVVVGPAPDAPPWVRAVASTTDRLPTRLARYGAAARAAVSDATVVDGHFALHTAAALASGAAVRRRPLVVHFQGPWAEESEAAGERRRAVLAAKRAVERAVYRRADAIVVLSPAFARILVERDGIEPWRIEVIAPGVDVERFTPGDRGAAREALGLGADDFVAVAARRLVPRTGVGVLVDAWARLPDAPRRSVLVVVGDGPEATSLHARARELGIADRVRFVGSVSDDQLVDAYRAADVSVVPSLELEGFGLVVLEALASGVPVIASDTGGLAPALAPLDPSLLVPPGDVEALAARLARARDEPLHLPDAARCRAEACTHSWATVADRHLSLFRAVAGRHDGAAGRDPRVVYLDHTAQPSGAELSLARTLGAATGFDAHVVLAADGPLVPLLDRGATSLEVLPMAESARGLARGRVGARLPVGSAAATARYVLRLTRRLRRLRPDVVHTNSLKAAVYGGVAARLAGVPVVWHVHDRIADDYLPRAAVRLVRGLAPRLADHVVVNSEATAATLPASVPVTVLPEAVPRPGGDRERAGGSPGRDGPLRVGIVGRLSPWKGQDLFLRAFARAFPDGDERAVVVGGALFGEHDVEERLRSLVADLGIADRVELLGHRDDVAGQLRRLDVLVHASLIPEPFGMVVAEGMAAGLAVVAADAAGPAEIIERDVDGILYPIGDEAALADALRRLAADPALRRELGDAARRRARDFEPAVVAAALREVYQRVLDERGQRRLRAGRLAGGAWRRRG